MKFKYQLIVDGKMVYEGNRIAVLKKEADFWFEYLNSFGAKIVSGDRLVASKLYDDNKWFKHIG